MEKCRCIPGHTCQPMPNRFRKTLQWKRWWDDGFGPEATPATDACADQIKTEGLDAEPAWCQSMEPVLLRREDNPCK